ncbi:Ig-like domain-containing protein [bacterium]|nr:Ig-like domain-containing protein [bacterium]
MAILYGLAVLILLTQTQCAQELSPTGGPKDSIDPRVVSVKPEPKTLNYLGDEVEIKFSEFIRRPVYGTDIFISPLLSKPPKISIKNGKKLKIKFEEFLRTDATYVISLTGIKDNNEGNEMDESYTLAFSTGAVIDSMEIRGKVETHMGLAQKEMTILLFDADSIVNEDFFRKQPAYITKTSDQGTFSLPYLRNIKYRIYGVVDADNSNSYSQPLEKIAFPDSSLVVFNDTSTVREVKMVSFLPDDRPPALRKVEWLSDSIVSLEMTEGMLAGSISIFISDTLGQESNQIETFTYLDRFIYLESPRKRDLLSKVLLKGLQDSLGNQADTLFDLFSRKIKKQPQPPLITPPKFNIRTLAYEWYMPVLLPDWATASITLVDTGGNQVPIILEQNSFKYSMKPDTTLTIGLTYKIEMEGKLFGEKDTVYSYKVKPFDKEAFGTFSGKIRIIDYEGPFVLFFEKKGQKPYVLKDTTFNLKNLEPGDYKASVILDTDSNGVWTPGFLQPYKLPEKIVKGSEIFSIRANWEFEEQVILIDPNKKAAPPLPQTSEGPKAGKGFNNSRPPGSRP